MRFLVTNDDGLGVAGLELLKRVASHFGQLTVVAPEVEQSGISHRLTFDRPLQVQQRAPDAYSVNGTPADCVQIAVSMLGYQFDWVLSGVNDGANLGVDVFYSGTVAAAREAAVLGIPAIAVSQYRARYSEPFDWKRQESIVANLLKKYVADCPDRTKEVHQWLNINLPDPIDYVENEPRFIECMTDFSPLPIECVESARGTMLTFKYRDRPAMEGKDVNVCFGGDVAISRHTIGNE